MTHRRVLVVVALTLVVLAAVGAGATYVLTRPDTSPAPATKRAVAAVTVDVLDIEPSSYDVNPTWDVPEPLGVEIRWHPGGSTDAHHLHVGIEPATRERTRCNRYASGCDEWDVGDGTVHLSWQEAVPEEDPGILVVSYAVDGEDRFVVYAGESLVGDPREQEDLPVGVDDLEALVTDERFASTTTREMVDTDLPKWPEDDRSGDSVPATPAVVARWMSEDGVRRAASRGPASTERYGEGAVGAVFRSPDRTTSVVLVPTDSPRVPECGAGWHCRTEQGVTTGWRPGVAIVIRESRDVVMLGTVRSAGIVDGLPRPPWDHGNTGWDYAALEHSYAQYGLDTTRAFARGSGGPRWSRTG